MGESLCLPVCGTDVTFLAACTEREFQYVSAGRRKSRKKFHIKSLIEKPVNWKVVHHGLNFGGIWMKLPLLLKKRPKLMKKKGVICTCDIFALGNLWISGLPIGASFFFFWLNNWMSEANFWWRIPIQPLNVRFYIIFRHCFFAGPAHECFLCLWLTENSEWIKKQLKTIAF